MVNRDYRFGTLDTADCYHAVSKHFFPIRVIVVPAYSFRAFREPVQRFAGFRFHSRQARNLMIKVRSPAKPSVESSEMIE
jgi:hypothetical protein